MTQYDYDKTPCAIDRLRQEIELSAIATAIDHIDLFGSLLSIFFDSDLSGGDKTILDNLVTAHGGTALAGDYIEISATALTTSNNSNYSLLNSMVSPHLIGGRYIVDFVGTFKTTVPLLSNPGVLVCVFVDGVQQSESEMAMNNDISGAPFNISTSNTVDIAKNKTIEIRWKTNGQGNTVSCLNRILILTRIGD